VGAILLFVALVFAMYAFARIPEPEDVVRSQSTIVLDRAGREIGRVHVAEDRLDVPLEEVPLAVRNAVIAAEDRSFYRHRGVSPLSVLRATLSNLIHREVRQGGSTITQQYVKNAFVGRERTLWRKLKEGVIAVKLERARSKDQILEAYLNTIYFGRGAYGIEAASRTYFAKPVRSLSLPEAALIAGIIRAPEALDPARNAAGALARRNRVLDAMAQMRSISPTDAGAAKNAPVKVTSRTASISGEAPAFLEDVRRALLAQFGADRVYRGGLRVTTTLDLLMQRAARKAVGSVLDRPDDPEAALVAVDPPSGGVRAMIGARDETKLKFNIAIQGRRQPGSAFKPFVLAAAVEEGIPVLRRFRAPARITLETGFQPWTVVNYDGRDYGSATLIEATELSINTVYAQLILKIGPRKAAAMAKEAGISSKLAVVPSLALGTSEVSPLELAGAYATFASGGLRARVHTISRVVDAGGSVLYASDEAPGRAVAKRVADTVSFALQKVISDGTGRRAAIGRPAAGKTGTTEDHRDAWFAGYTPDLAATVWMGYADGSRRMDRVRGIAVTGGSFPAWIWKAFMTAALRGTPPHGFDAPELTSPTPSAAPSGSPSSLPSPTLPPPASPPSSSPSPLASPSPKKSSSPSPSPSSS
jgi:penicillin-binding protein 1A